MARPSLARPRFAWLLLGALALGLACCGKDEPTPPFTPTAAQVTAHNAALGLMGRFEIEAAVPAFDAVVKDAPRWHDARVNLAIALLNTQESKALDRALVELERVRKEDPAHLRAPFVAGLIHLFRGFADRALPLLTFVAEADPEDSYALSWVGSAYQALERYPEAVTWFTRAFTKDPYLRSAYYGAFQSLQAADRGPEADRALEASERLGTNPLARTADFKYTRMGPKAMAVVGSARAAAGAPARPAGAFFAEEPAQLSIGGPAFQWAAEPGPITSVDLDADGHLDLFLVGARATPEGPRGLLLRGSAADFVAMPEHPLGQVADVNAALWGDLDNDGRVDVYLCRRGENRLLLQREGGVFEDVTALAQAGGGPWNTVDGLLADLDHDGDLDIYLVNADSKNELLSNNLDGSFRTLGESTGVGGDGRPSVGALAADLDADRDLDLVVLHAEPPQEVFWNDRLWAWHKDDAATAASDPRGYAAFLRAPARAIVAADPEGVGRVELLTAQGASLTRWTFGPAPRWFSRPVFGGPERGHAPAGSPSEFTALLVSDFDGDMRLDLFAAGSRPGVRTEGTLEGELARAGGPWLFDGAPAGRQRAALLTRDPQRGAEVLLLHAGMPAVRPNGLSLLAPARLVYGVAGLTFSGRHHEADSMRSNASGLGVRAAVQVGSMGTIHHHLRNQSGPGQSLQPLFVGLGSAPRLDFVTLDWPDGLLQTEIGLEAGKVHRIEEVQRQTSSCPVLFCWDGTKQRFVTDLLGVGGIGFWVAPDTYAPPLPREHVLLPEGLPVAKDGRYLVKLSEPMEETCYLDHADLVAWDLPAGWQMVLDERMGVMGPVPTSEPRFFRRECVPSSAFANGGVDVTAAIRQADLKAAPVGPLDQRFLGRTKGSVLTLEFDESLDLGAGQPMLVADGWIEYPYAQTLFAAWQAGAEYKAPTLEARGVDGVWVVVQEQLGYPAGMPRRMSFPLPKLPPDTRALRLSGTYEVYWDRVVVAFAEPCPEARRHVIPRVKADLRASGFARRTTGAQRVPHYDWERRTPLWDCRHQKGLYTRLGDVEALLAETDDAVVVFGPGEEAHLEFSASLPPAASGVTRRFVLETTGWCKDSDLCTKDGDTVGPLPVREGVIDTRARDALHAATLTRVGSMR